MVFRRLAKIAILALTFGVLMVGFQALTVKADVPNVVSVAHRNVGSATWLDITVRHGGPSSIHYVSSVRLEINGTAQNLALTPQSTETFVVSYNLGPSSNKYSVRALADCNLHGDSAWSGVVVVPEFSFYAMVLFLVLTTLAIVFGKKAQSLRRSTRSILRSR
jgi:hypothetical protein